ncbi:MAG: TIGR04282 family arsenosugar biosynthesis glycosyltransferase [Planctomycetes bacterium]|nr:TIGR04282 family arsenosugar biosynthesis glycosyltransferase [Planctomycetota bacterium]
MRTIVVMAKAPLPGVAKTRLAAAPGVGREGAARLAEGLFLDTLATANAFAAAAGERELVLAFAPDAERAWFAAVAPGARLVAQVDGTLSPRLVHATEDAFARGASAVVVVGTDAPELVPEDLERAFELLARHPVVLGPSLDGGYWLVGLARPAPRLFEGIPWSTERVFALTLARAKELGLSVAELAPHFDVDAPTDLARLERWLATVPVDRAPHIRAALAGLAR